MEITIQPLVSALKGKNFYFRLSQDDNNNYILDLGKKLASRGLSVKKYKIISGNELVVPEVTYTITEESYNRNGNSTWITPTQLSEVDKLVSNCFKFRDTHHVTTWKD